MKALFIAAPAALCLLLVGGCGGSGGSKLSGLPLQAGHLVDITQASGLGAFTHIDGSSGRRFFPEQVGSGCVIFDYDNDGWQDIYLCNGAPLPGYHGPNRGNALFHNNHDGTFTDVTQKAGIACRRYCTGAVAGDYNNDGYLDLYVCCLGVNVLYRNNGDGTFTDVTRKAGVGDPRFSTSACFFDYDHDGYLDLYVANYVKYDLQHDIQCGRLPGRKSYCGPNTYPAEADTLYHNNGNGAFTDVSQRAGIRSRASSSLGVISLDYDGDGKPDLFVACDQRPNLLWHNNGDGTFTDLALQEGVAYGEKGTAQAGMGVDAGDTRHNGQLDILLSTFTGEPESLYRQENGVYHDDSFRAGIGESTQRTLGFGTGFLDYDNDGWLDIFVANGHVMDDIGSYSDASWAEPNQLFHNRGEGTFEDVSDRVLGDRKEVSRGAAFGDLFQTGRTDILVNTLRSHPILLRNDWAPDSHWITLDLKASWGNPQAVGASVYLTAGNMTQRRDVRAGGSYASGSDLRPHFGLGQATCVDYLKVAWPSGQQTELKNLPVDRIVFIQEPPRTRH